MKRQYIKRQLRIDYKDGGKIKITNFSYQEEDINFFLPYTKEKCVEGILNAGIYTYPLKNNDPLILVKNGEAIHPEWFR